MSITLPKIYPITDRRCSGLSHAEQVARLSEGGATLVQVREKQLAPREFYLAAESAMTVARERGVQLLINDRVDIALAIGADGVHLGQDDLDPEAARRLLGENAIIGFSTHNLEQARQAMLRWPVDYIAIGPIFNTASKDHPDPTVGLEGLRQVYAEVGNSMPLVAIGGVTHANAQAVFDAGASAVALISAVLAGNPSEIPHRLRAFLTLEAL